MTPCCQADYRHDRQPPAPQRGFPRAAGLEPSRGKGGCSTCAGLRVTSQAARFLREPSRHARAPGNPRGPEEQCRGPGACAPAAAAGALRGPRAPRAATDPRPGAEEAAQRPGPRASPPPHAGPRLRAEPPPPGDLPQPLLRRPSYFWARGPGAPPGDDPAPEPHRPGRPPPTGILHHGPGEPAGSPGAAPHGRPQPPPGAPRPRGASHLRADAHRAEESPQPAEAARDAHRGPPPHPRPATGPGQPRAHPVPSAMRSRDSAHSAAVQSRVAIHSRSSRVSSRIHPQFTQESGIWMEEEKLHKRKGKMQRAHKKKRSGNYFHQFLEKLNQLIWSFRNMMRELIQSMVFETFIFIFVCLNTIMLVAQTFAEVEIRGEWYFMAFDCVFLCIYVIEALLKIIALGLKYFYDPWNNLDFFIMVMAVLDFVFIQINSLTYSFYNHSVFRILKVFKSLRALRALRVLRRFSILTSVHEVTGTLARTLPSITAILILMFTCMFLFSVVLRGLFRHSDPKRFQSILTTIFTLFTLLTLDDWSLIYLDSRAQGAWYIIPILMIYIIIQYFIFLNLVIAVLVDNFQMALLKNLEKVKQEKAAQIQEKLLDDSLTELRRSGTAWPWPLPPHRQKELQFLFLQLVAAVEQQQQKFRSQASILDEIVDTAFEAGEEDFSQ
ncbi:cation channel sperm-associated protein 1 [Perognathus longimembris pacificus]|uniref:cation channel sperm-associated protein 1 n=1 Tax=Perognathus longimembris pacificus TaxID=214514 RepID=UPI002019C246|nr:cation channel sperm-associated protein 1 [Perognathus longimembris pacificus]